MAWLTDEAQGVVHFACDDGLSASAEICNNYGQKVLLGLLLRNFATGCYGVSLYFKSHQYLNLVYNSHRA